ncbi:MAG TPA: argininosuccinate lyase [Candidatus Limnocylindrales bacterium]|nr:argininosuccinate lyase [Candidatus Limnocylindrales bacterium]
MRSGGPDRGAAVGGARETSRQASSLIDASRGGRLPDPPDPVIDRFLRSLPYDQRLWREDIAGSRGWAKALAQAGVLSPEEGLALDRGLTSIAADLEAGTPFPGDGEDVHMTVEALLTQQIGAAGGKLHTGRSRNDQVATDLRLWVREAGSRLQAAIRELIAAIAAQAAQHVDTVMPGYTHTQRAQPVVLAHHLLAYVEMLARDQGRLHDALDRAEVLPLGAGALAGSGFPIDRQALARDLGFRAASANSLDAVSDRDFVLELMSAMSILMIHLSRLAAEIVLWTTAEFGFAALPDRLASGSSMMPNKKNACAAELVRAKSGRVTGALVAMLMVMKGLPLAYNRDLQEDKEGLFDAVETTRDSLAVMTILVHGLTFDVERMRAAALEGYTLATELADYLVRKGLPFRDAHRAVGAAVSYAGAAGKRLEELTLDELHRFSPRFEPDVYDHLTLRAALDARAVYGGTAPARVAEALTRAQA